MNALATVQVDDFLSWGVRKADHSDIQCKYYVITYILVQDSFYPRTGYAGRSSALVYSQETLIYNLLGLLVCYCTRIIIHNRK